MSKQAKAIEFVKIWQTSNNIDDVLNKLKFDKSKRAIVIATATRFRKNGVPLKVYKNYSSLNFKELSELAHKINRKKT